MSSFANVFAQVLAPMNILGVVAGVFIGMIIGAMPGLSATLAVALCVPITYSLSPVAGISMLAAVYTSAVYGGSITASLLHTPGTPASAATADDGYALTQRGQGMKAIGLCTVASMIGGTFAAIMLMLIAEPLSKLSLAFAPIEYMLVAVFGLMIIGSLAGDNLVKGLMVGVLGMIVACVGLDKMNAAPRYTFGILSLESGLSMVPCMIGMFSISQVMLMVEDIVKGQNSIVTNPKDSLNGKTLPTKAEFKRMIPTMGQSSIIGLLVGIMPGAGGDIGSWVSYNIAKKSTKHPEEFGHGSIEAITASETANNAVSGGAMIPLLTLGIPGSSAAAVLLGGLQLHGLNPGFELFSKYADLTYAIMISFLIANILMGIVGLLTAKTVARVALVPNSVLAVIIVVLSTVGAFAINRNMFDAYCMMIFGLLGYFCRKAHFGTAPMVLGVILGPMIESNFRRTLVISRGDMLGYLSGRPIALVLIVLILAALFLPKLISIFNSKVAGLRSETSGDEDL